MKNIFFSQVSVLNKLTFSFLLVPALLAGFFIFGRTAKADSIIISQNTTWYDGQVIIVDDQWDGLTIQSGVKLTVEAGAVIKLADYNDIKVYGDLEIEGLADKPVIITSLKDDSFGGDSNGDGSATKPVPGSWGKIRTFGSSAQINIDYAQIKYGGALMVFPCFAGGPLSEFSAGNKILIIHSQLIDNQGIFDLGQADFLKINYSNIYNNYNPNYCYERNGGMDCGAQIENNTDGIFDLINNYWGNSFGPTVIINNDDWDDPQKGTYILGQAEYLPFLTSPWAPELKTNPVIFVPGIEGSVLKERGFIFNNEIWPDPLNYIADPIDEQLGKLKMDKNGNSINNIFAADAIRDVWGTDIYGSLIDYLRVNGYKENKNLFIFPYDWRLDIDSVAGDAFPCESTTTLKCLIDEVKRETGSDKVDIIAHSMGGLVVKDYAYKFGQDSIGKFIDIATPHLGAPKAAKILQYGDNLGFEIIGTGVLNNSTVRGISLQMPSIYQLLPSQEYFNIPDSGYGYYLYNDSSVGGTSLKGELNYDNSLSYLSAGNNKITKYFTGKNNALHSAIDNVKIDNSYNISGCGIATIGNIKSLGKKAFFWDKYDMDPVDGDGTVPLRSADYYGDNDKKYYLLGKTHSQIPGASEVKDFIYLTLNNQEDRYPFSESKVFKKDDSLCAISGEFIGYHCPVDMHIYDDQGNHTGPVENGDIENNIPGVQYDIIDGNKFAFLPAGGNYRVTGEAVGTGTLEVVIRKVENNQNVETKYFNSIRLSSTAVRTEINLISGQDSSDIKIDENGDGVFEEQKSPDTVLSGDDMSDLTKPNTAIGVIGVDGNNSYYVSDVKVSLVAFDDNSGVLKTEYSLDGGKIWIKYVGELILTQNGTNTIWYSSTDRAGNREENKELVIKIDTEKPEINIFLPQEGQEILRNKELKLEYLAEDATSGVLPDSKEVYFDGQKANQEVFDMFSYAIGSHKVKIKISDLAGSISEKEVNFKVIADITSTISDIEKLFNEKDIANKKVKDDLIGDLNWVDNYLEKNVKKQVKREEIKKEIMDKCIQKKGEAWCAEKVGRTLDKVDYHLNEIQNKIVQLKYELLLKKLEVYRKLNFVSQKGYNIIKEDVKYLISKI